MAKIGNFPLIIRPAFTLGGTGGGIAYNMEEFQEIIASGLDASMTNQARARAKAPLFAAHHRYVLRVHDLGGGGGGGGSWELTRGCYVLRLRSSKLMLIRLQRGLDSNDQRGATMSYGAQLELAVDTQQPLSAVVQ